LAYHFRHMKRYIFALLLAAALLPISVSAAQSKVSTTTPKNTEWRYDRLPVSHDYGSEVYTRQPYEDEDLVKVYLVRNNRLYEDKTWRLDDKTGDLSGVDFTWTKDRTTEEYKIWNMFAAIAGSDFVKKNIVIFETYRDVETSILGLVWRSNIQGPSWTLAINANAADFGNKKWEKDMAITLIHEYAHILTLNKDQIKYKRNTRNSFTCPTGMGKSRIGCAYKKSYFNAYLQEFWSVDDIKYLGTVEAETDEKKQWTLVEKYYKAHQDDFVSQYAATRPEEDIAESFTDFILQPKPQADLKEKDRKILFFYRFPELVSLRTNIRAAVATYFTK
jgi:hypothetical protein